MDNTNLYMYDIRYDINTRIVRFKTSFQVMNTYLSLSNVLFVKVTNLVWHLHLKMKTASYHLRKIVMEISEIKKLFF